MDFFCLSFTSGSNIQLQAKIGKIASQKEKNYCPKFQNRPSFAPLQVFASHFTPFQIFAPRGAIRPTLGNPVLEYVLLKTKPPVAIGFLILDFFVAHKASPHHTKELMPSHIAAVVFFLKWKRPLKTIQLMIRPVAES